VHHSVEAKGFPLLCNIQYGSGVHPAPCSMGTGILSWRKSGPGVTMTVNGSIAPPPSIPS